MPTINLQPQQPDSPFYEDMITFGYHIYNLKYAEIPGYYPNEFPGDIGASIKDLKVGDMITVRVFFKVGDGEEIQADGGYMGLEVEHIYDDKVLAVILTELPEEFPLTAGGSIDIFEGEILSKDEATEH